MIPSPIDAKPLLPGPHRHDDERRPAGGHPQQRLGNVGAAQLERGDAGAHGEGKSNFSWLTVAGLLFLTFNSSMAVYRSRGEPWAIAFVLFAYTDLVALFGCLRMYEATDQDSPRREHLKVAVWILTTLLTAAFSYKVAAIMPLPVAILVWAMAFATVAGGYFAFFLYEEK